MFQVLFCDCANMFDCFSYFVAEIYTFLYLCLFLRNVVLLMLLIGLPFVALCYWNFLSIWKIICGQISMQRV